MSINNFEFYIHKLNCIINSLDNGNNKIIFKKFFLKENNYKFVIKEYIFKNNEKELYFLLNNMLFKEFKKSEIISISKNTNNYLYILFNRKAYLFKNYYEIFIDKKLNINRINKIFNIGEIINSAKFSEKIFIYFEKDSLISYLDFKKYYTKFLKILNLDYDIKAKYFKENFNNFNEELWSEYQDYFKIRKFFKKNYIYKKNDVFKHIYIIIKGEVNLVDVVKINVNKTTKCIKYNIGIRKKNDIIGLENINFNFKKHNHSMVVSSDELILFKFSIKNNLEKLTNLNNYSSVFTNSILLVKNRKNNIINIKSKYKKIYNHVNSINIKKKKVSLSKINVLNKYSNLINKISDLKEKLKKKNKAVEVKDYMKSILNKSYDISKNYEIQFLKNQTYSIKRKKKNIEIVKNKLFLKPKINNIKYFKNILKSSRFERNN